MKREVGWAIAGKIGLYEGWWQRRCDAIAHHVHTFAPAVGSWVSGAKLDEAQKRAWKDCEELGDRAVKVEIRWW